MDDLELRIRLSCRYLCDVAQHVNVLADIDLIPARNNNKAYVKKGAKFEVPYGLIFSNQGRSRSVPGFHEAIFYIYKTLSHDWIIYRQDIAQSEDRIGEIDDESKGFSWLIVERRCRREDFWKEKRENRSRYDRNTLANIIPRDTFLDFIDTHPVITPDGFFIYPYGEKLIDMMIALEQIELLCFIGEYEGTIKQLREMRTEWVRYNETVKADVENILEQACRNDSIAERLGTEICRLIKQINKMSSGEEKDSLLNQTRDAIRQFRNKNPPTKDDKLRKDYTEYNRLSSDIKITLSYLQKYRESYMEVKGQKKDLKEQLYVAVAQYMMSRQVVVYTSAVFQDKVVPISKDMRDVYSRFREFYFNNVQFERAREGGTTGFLEKIEGIESGAGWPTKIDIKTDPLECCQNIKAEIMAEVDKLCYPPAKN